MNKIILIRDILIGGILAGTFSYISTLYYDNPSYIKVAAYLWGAPCFWFVLLFIAWDKDNLAAVDVSQHAGLGQAVTLIAVILTLLFFNLGKDIVIGINILILLLAIFSYFYHEIYLL